MFKIYKKVPDSSQFTYLISQTAGKQFLVQS